MTSDETISELRSLQADLNLYCQVANFEGLTIDGKIGPRSFDALKKIIAAVLAKNSLLIPAAFTANNADDVVKYATPIRAWLHSTAATTLNVSPFRVYERGEGKDWNVKGDIAYGKGAVHDEFLGIQRELNKLASRVGFDALEVDGFIGPKTAAAVKKTFDKVVAKNALLGVTLFPPPNTKEEAAAFAQFIHDWLANTASKHV
jgi:lysozyme family protein